MMKKTTANNPDVQDDDDPNDIGPKTANKPKGREEKSQLEGPAAYAPHDESEKLNRSTGHSPPDPDSTEGAVKPDDGQSRAAR
jgi:hypothetical protein